LSKINNHKDGESAYLVAGRKLSSGKPVTVLEQSRFHTFSERSSESLVHFNKQTKKQTKKGQCKCHGLSAASISHTAAVVYGRHNNPPVNQ